jgi:carboxyl-terminal processing protease
MRKVAFGIIGAAAGFALTIGALELRVVLPGADAKTVAPAKQFRALGLFDVAFEWVRAGYVEKPNDNRLIESAINGMLAGLEDSYYLNAATANRLTACGATNCGGVGIKFTIVDGLPKIVTPIDDSPAAKAGLMAGDVITALDNNSVDGLTSYEVAQRLAGNVGTTLRVEFARPGKDKLIVVPLVRDNITPRSVRARVDGGDIGYIRIIQFNDATADQLKKAISDIASQVTPEKLKGYVIDLRDNPGGVAPDGAVAAVNAFLNDGDIGSIRGRKGDDNRSFHAHGGDLSNGKKIAVLINGGTASLAEVVAGALKDNHRATLIGTRSFGEGSVATTIQLGSGKGVLHLAIGHYVTPSGSVIEGKGIAPDVEAPQDVPADLKADAKSSSGKGDDASSEDSKQPPLQSYIPPDATADKALTVAYDLLRK